MKLVIHKNRGVLIEKLILFKKRAVLAALFLNVFTIFGNNNKGTEPIPKLAYHAFHTSITEIELNQKAKIYEISVRVFTDDLEKAIDTKNKIKGTKIIDDDKNDALVASYISSQFSIISTKNQKVAFKYIGKENEDLATWIYIEIPISSMAKGVKIRQNVLMELFDDQVNIVNFKKGEERKTFLFDTKNKSHSWQ
jgi:hypothetical protein